MAIDTFEDYMKRIRENIQSENPDKKITLKKQVEFELTDCEYCSNEGKALFEIPFSDTCIKVSGDKIAVSCSCGLNVDLYVTYCPKCGRKLHHDN